MGRQYFAYLYRLDGALSSLVWFSNDRDGVLLDERGRCPAFRSQPGLRRFAAGLGLTVEPTQPGSKILDLDEIARWRAMPTKSGITCEPFLDAWNLFDDVARTVGHREFLRASVAEGVACNKLFWGCNLPSVTPPGEHFDPTWSAPQVKAIRKVLGRGMRVFRQVVADPG